MNNESNNIGNQIPKNNQNMNSVNPATFQFQTGVYNNVVQDQGYGQANSVQPPQTMNQNYQQPSYQNHNLNNFEQPTNNGNNKNRKVKKPLYIIVGILIVGIILTSIFIFGGKKNYTRTIMIYMVGSDLESEHGLATVDLNEIKYNLMDNKNVNVLLIAGGSKTWNNNYIDVNESSIYELKESGFVKVKNQSKTNMGSPEVLSDFLTYVYNNYKTDKYTLMFWNHGAAILGSEFDELSDDNLSIDDWKKALSNSPFDKNNKLEMIIFSTCLNGTLEVADTFVDYSDYLVASEETTIGYKLEGDLNFINKIKTSDSGYDVAFKFVTSYKEKIKNYKKLYTKYYGESDLYSTYSIVDLSSIRQLESSVNEFFSSIDVEKDYNTIAKIRSNLYQYAYTQNQQSSYDMVDLYNLIDGIKELSPNKANKVLNNINKAVLYNWATNSQSRGISIYFPYNAENRYKKYFLNLYNNFNSLQNYNSFINKFYLTQTSPYTAYSYSNNNIKISDNDNESDFTLELSDEQLKTFARANYMVFRDNKDGYFLPVYRGKEVSLKGNILSANIKDRQLKVISKDNAVENILTLIEVSSNDEYIKYNTMGILERVTPDFKMDSASLSLIYDKQAQDIKIGSVILNSSDEYKPSTVAVDLKDYTNLIFGSSKYKILDDKGNYDDNWESNGVFEGFKGTINEISFKLQSFDDEYDYYAVFIIWDTNNNSYYSKLVKMN